MTNRFVFLLQNFQTTLRQWAAFLLFFFCTFQNLLGQSIDESICWKPLKQEKDSLYVKIDFNGSKIVEIKQKQNLEIEIRITHSVFKYQNYKKYIGYRINGSDVLCGKSLKNIIDSLLILNILNLPDPTIHNRNTIICDGSSYEFLIQTQQKTIQYLYRSPENYGDFPFVVNILDFLKHELELNKLFSKFVNTLEAGTYHLHSFVVMCTNQEGDIFARPDFSRKLLTDTLFERYKKAVFYRKKDSLHYQREPAFWINLPKGCKSPVMFEHPKFNEYVFKFPHNERFKIIIPYAPNFSVEDWIKGYTVGQFDLNNQSKYCLINGVALIYENVSPERIGFYEKSKNCFKFKNRK